MQADFRADIQALRMEAEAQVAAEKGAAEVLRRELAEARSALEAAAARAAEAEQEALARRLEAERAHAKVRYSPYEQQLLFLSPTVASARAQDVSEKCEGRTHMGICE